MTCEHLLFELEKALLALIRDSIGSHHHLEVVAHTLINAFFISNDFRKDVEVYVVLDSSEDFPRTLKFSGNDISMSGFHEAAAINLIETALSASNALSLNQTILVAPGIEINGFGFEKLVNNLLVTRPIYLLDRKGTSMRTLTIAANPVFLLSDHLSMPKNNVKSLKRRGVQAISLSKKMLFASQCVVLIHYEMDLQVN